MPEPSGVPESLELECSEPEIVTGIVESIEDGIAMVLVGPEQEEWHFPVEILSERVVEDSVLLLERSGRNLRFVELDVLTDLTGKGFDQRLRRTARKLRFTDAPDAG